MKVLYLLIIFHIQECIQLHLRELQLNHILLEEADSLLEEAEAVPSVVEEAEASDKSRFYLLFLL